MRDTAAMINAGMGEVFYGERMHDQLMDRGCGWDQLKPLAKQWVVRAPQFLGEAASAGGSSSLKLLPCPAFPGGKSHCQPDPPETSLWLVAPSHCRNSLAQAGPWQNSILSELVRSLEFTLPVKKTFTEPQRVEKPEEWPFLG